MTQNPNDTEEMIWHFICNARQRPKTVGAARALAAARAELLHAGAEVSPQADFTAISMPRKPLRDFLCFQRRPVMRAVRTHAIASTTYLQCGSDRLLVLLGGRAIQGHGH